MKQQLHKISNLLLIKNSYLFFVITITAVSLLSNACQPVVVQPERLSIKIIDNNNSKDLQILTGINVENALTGAGITLNPLDKVEPPGYSIIESEITITIIRVSESFEAEEVIIPFETQTMKNETLTEGQTLLVQSGVNGVQQNTYRKITENDLEVSRSLFKQEMLVEPKPEIIMVGIQTPFTEIKLTGRIAYLSSGNAWIMEESTGNRYPIVTSGDLDGRIFSLSPDADWLLFTKFPEDEASENINELWVVNIDLEAIKPIYLRVNNIVHFADWVPYLNMTVAYSTVETRETAPGWQANNDLFSISFNENGIILQKTEIIPSNSGGIYGWWGTEFFWLNDGENIAFSRPDSIGLVDFQNQELIPLITILPFQTKGSWAWIPGVAWSPDGEILFFVDHLSNNGSGNSEASPNFSLSAFLTEELGNSIEIRPSTGMFTYPVISAASNDRYFVSFLQAFFPDQSDNSDYALYVMDQDGSNTNKVFPPEGAPGLKPQKVVWSPIEENQAIQISFIYEGNLWLVDVLTSNAFQITGDESITKIDWK